jgi:selenocysteine-specific elongation factor
VPTRFVVAGTAGHIDHGKTELVRALTGTWTDRLKEEQERGISIDLGFAELQLDGDISVGLVDVPGHERFVRNMLAGVGGIDFVLLVVAADEGVMPQTREHVDIIELLGVKAGVVALTKVDLVDDPEWLELVELDVSELLSPTGLAQAPIIPVSSITGQGLDKLRSTLCRIAGLSRERESGGDFRLPIDRVFTVKGFGTVVTGTVWSGRVSAGDTIALEPGGRHVRVRNVQVHGIDRKSARAGQRAALALAGIDKQEIARGVTACLPGSLTPSFMVDARVKVLPEAERPLIHRQRIHCHHGTAESLARVVPLEGEAIAPGESGVVQLRLENPMALLPGDRFVLRQYSPLTSIAGGVVLDPWARKHRRQRADVLHGLGVRESGSAEEVAAEVLRGAGPEGMDTGDTRLWAALERIPEEGRSVAEILDSSVQAGQIARLPSGRLIAARYLHTALKQLEMLIDAHHRRHPLQAGLPSNEAASRLSTKQPGIAGSAIVDLAIKEGIVRKQEGRIARPEFEVRLTPQDVKEQERWLNALGGDARFIPPAPDQVIQTAPDPQRSRALLHALLDKGELIRLTQDLVMTGTALAEIEQGVIEMLQKKGEISVADVRERFGCTRKYLIPLLEHMDRKGITRRSGDRRTAGVALTPERAES